MMPNPKGRRQPPNSSSHFHHHPSAIPSTTVGSLPQAGIGIHPYLRPALFLKPAGSHPCPSSCQAPLAQRLPSLPHLRGSSSDGECMLWSSISLLCSASPFTVACSCSVENLIIVLCFALLVCSQWLALALFDALLTLCLGVLLVCFNFLANSPAGAFLIVNGCIE